MAPPWIGSSVGVASFVGFAIVCGMACVLPTYEGSSGEGGSVAQGAPVTGSSGSLSTTSTSDGSGAIGSSGAGASTSSNGGTSSGAGGSTSGSSAGPGGGDDVGSSATSGAASSSGSGTACLPPLDPCADVEPFDFADQGGLEERFDVDQSVAEVQGGKLRLDPSGNEAVLKAKQDAAFDGDCAVWIMLHTTSEQGRTGLGLGNGSLSGASLRLQRDGDRLVAVVKGGEAADAPFDAEAMRHVRIRVVDGDAYFDYAAGPTCWTELSGPHAPEGAKPTLFHEGPGDAKLDDYCLD